RILRAYADFAVRYGELIGPRAEDLSDLELALPDRVWSVSRRSGRRLAINLINMAGLEDPVWTESHPAPHTLNNFPVRLFVGEKVQHVYYACPDNDDLSMKPLSWSSGDRWIKVIVPSLEFWTMLVVETLPTDKNRP
ncbi:MAG: glycoside hydrolase family 66 protein, partial [Anaerolineales bacterium]